MDADEKINPGLIVEPGVVIAKRFEICNRIGAGGVGMVYRAIDRELDGEVVALKLLLPHLAQDEQVFRRFRNEVLVARSLSHPNIVRTHDMGRAAGGYSYISMEFVDGVSLKEKLAVSPEDTGISSPLSFDQALAILYQIIGGVSYAHGKGVIHRDLKPANVLISVLGEVKLADFGTARIMGMDTSLTQTGQVIGTPDYMSPEQIRGEALDQACDIYALGMIAYELVVGKRAFIADSAVAVAFKHLNDPIPAFASPQKGIPGWYEKVIRTATAKKREDRFSSVMEFAAALLDYAPQLSVQSTFFTVDRSAVRSTILHAGSPGTGTTTGPALSGNGRPGANGSEPRFELGTTVEATDTGTGWRMGFDEPSIASVLTTKDGKSVPVAFLVGGAVVLLAVLTLLSFRFVPALNTVAQESLHGRQFVGSEMLSALVGVARVKESEPVVAPPVSPPIEIAAVSPTTPAVTTAPGTSPTLTSSPVPTSSPLPTMDPETRRLQEELTGVPSDPTQVGSPASNAGTKSGSDSHVAKVENPNVAGGSGTLALAGGVETKQTEADSDKTPVPTPVVTAPPAKLSATLFLRSGSGRANEDSFSLDRLGELRWFVTLNGSTAGWTAEKVRDAFAINIVDLAKGALVTKIGFERPQMPVSAGESIRAQGDFSSWKRAKPEVGRYRIDVIATGEVVASRELEIYKASVVVSQSPEVASSGAAGGSVAIIRGASATGEATPTPAPLTEVVPVVAVPPTPPVEVPFTQPSPSIVAPPSSGSGLPIAKGHEGTIEVINPPSAVDPATSVVNQAAEETPAIRETYGGFLTISTAGGAEEKRVVILNLEFRGAQITGSGEVAGYGNFSVSGRVHPRGLDIELSNPTSWIRLSSGQRDRQLRGRYSLPREGKKGSFELTRTGG